MKGLLKGFKYISQIFEEKEEEFQIGLPTDVKHVAHIGWDGPSVNNTPSWMNEFKSPENPDGILNGEVKVPSTKSSSQDTLKTGEGIQDSLPRSKRQPSAGNGSPLDSPTRRSSEVPPKHSRHHRSSGGSTDSLTRHSRKQHNSNPGTESLSGDLTPVPKHSRRQQNSNLGPESLSGDITHVPKHSRRKKSKGSSGSISKSSRSKEQNSLNESLPFEEHGSEASESRHSLMNNENHLNSVLEECEGEGERR